MFNLINKPLKQLCLLTLPLCMLGSAYAADQTTAWEPSRAIEYIAPANAGGGWDTLVRTTSRVIQEEGLAPQNLAPINIPGGGGSVAWARIAGDGSNPHKLFATSPPIILVPLAGTSRYDHGDFQPIARLITDYTIILVDAESPYQSINDLFDAMRENPRQVSIGGGSAAGSMDHIAVAGAAAAAGVSARDVNYIPFSGGGEAMTNLMGGHVNAVVGGAGEAVGQLGSGRLRALAVASPERLDSMPDVPTLREQGVDYTFDIWRGVMGPKDMPEAAVRYYEQLFARMMETERWNEAASRLGWLGSYQNAEEFGAFLDAQEAQFRTVLADLGLLRQQ